MAERARAIVARRRAGDGPRRPDAADRDRARRLPRPGPHRGARPAGARRRARAAGGRLLRDRLRGDPRRGDRRDHAAHGDPGDRHRRRPEHRRPGARPARPARRSTTASSRSSSSATRRVKAEMVRGVDGLRRGGPHARASPAPSTPTASRPRSSSGFAGELRRSGSTRTAYNNSFTPTLARRWPACPSCSRRKEREFFDLFEEAGAQHRARRRAARAHARAVARPRRARARRRRLRAGGRPDHARHHPAAEPDVRHADRPRGHLALASALDDIVDFIEEVADFLGLYRIEAPMEQAQQLARDPPRGLPRRSASAIPRAAHVQGHPPLHGRDQPARERGRPHASARRSRRCSSTGSTR